MAAAKAGGGDTADVAIARMESVVAVLHKTLNAIFFFDMGFSTLLALFLPKENMFMFSSVVVCVLAYFPTEGELATPTL